MSTNTTPKKSHAGDSKPRDLFADLAGQRAQYRDQVLRAPEPPPRPANRLPATADPAAVAWAPLPKLRTEAALNRELARLRRRHAPFLRDLAPAVDSTRLVTPLPEFAWRIEGEEDRRHFPAVLDGAGTWETVRIPHYGAPLGRASTLYRTEFEVTPEMQAKGALFACFDGVDYVAEVYVNGLCVGTHEGFFAPFEFEIGGPARPGRNTLLVRVLNDAATLGNESWGADGHLYDGDKIYAATGPGYDDPAVGWHHCPPGMGIYQPVRIEARSPQSIHDLFVRPLPEEGMAEVWVEIWNCDKLRHEDYEVTLAIFGQNFRATVRRDQAVALPGPFYPAHNQFRFRLPMPKNFRWWNPDSPWLYQLQARLWRLPKAGDAGGAKVLADARRQQFGMRSFRLDEACEPKGRFILNGREIRLRGANTMGFEQQDIMKNDWKRLVDDILLAKLCNMNFLRLTQRPVQRPMYELCDRLGLMLQSDLPLFALITRRQFTEGVRQAREMEKLIRAHACSIAVTYINEPFPLTWVPKKAGRMLSRPELESFFLACDQAVRLENPDRVIKPVDGDYDPPAVGLPDTHCYCCWYNGHGVEIGKLHRGWWQPVKPGWNYGCGEFGAEGLEAESTMRAHYPKDWLPRTPAEEHAWTPERIVQAQSWKFHFMWYDTQRTMKDWIAFSQRHQAWSTRIMTEAFRRDARMVSIAIHLFIDAFPSGWMKTIMDVDRHPKPAFFAYREALAPFLVSLRTDRAAWFAGETVGVEAWLCNDTQEAPAGARLRWRVLHEGRAVAAGDVAAEVVACSSRCQGLIEFTAPAAAGRGIMTLQAALVAADGQTLTENELELTLFPALPAAVPAAPAVTVLGAEDGPAARLARELGLAPAPAGTIGALVLADDPVLVTKQAAALRRAVRAGTRVVLLELPAGKHAVAGDEIEVLGCSMGGRQFVSRDTGHPLVKGFKTDDFKMWFDPAGDCVTTLLDRYLHLPENAGWKTVLQSGGHHGGWHETTGGGHFPAAAEKRDGKGAWLICQVKLAGRLANPVAALFARRLVAAGG